MPAHSHDIAAYAHSHAFGDASIGRRERALAWVTVVTFVTMAVELLAGWWSGSLALTADGWHMGTHALALGGAALAYRFSARANARTVSGAPADFAFGGWKIELLAAYSSGLLLLAVAFWLVVDSIGALHTPRVVAYDQAIVVAVIGLGVNLLSAWLLMRGERGSGGDEHAGSHEHSRADSQRREHHQGHHHGHHHPHGQHHRDDHNFSAAYLHVVADAFTSVLAIVALSGGLLLGWRWLDPAVALLGAAVIGQWAFSVLRRSARGLVDATQDATLAGQVRELIEVDGDAKVEDLHLWQVGGQCWAAVVTVVADRPLSANAYHARLDSLAALRHTTIEVHRCPGGH
jgi:cation diffusion facilitator family transporter